ncbi:MAG: BatD family protein [Spirochaetales bacterium]|nr:BatD family protein [Spirochaetales bacterium]
MEEISPNPLGRGQRFSITFTLDFEDSEAVQTELPALPEGIQLYRGPIIRPVWVQSETGGYRKNVTVTTTFQANREGRTILGGFLLKIGDEEYRTGYHLVRVGSWINRQLVIPYEPVWIVPEVPIYIGQAVPVVLAVQNMEEVALFDGVLVDQPAGAMFERIPGIGSIESYTTGDITLYHIPVSSFMLTPSREGTLVLPAAEVRFGDVTGKSSAARINVLPPPEEIRSSGAIGSFTYTANMDAQEALVGDELVLTTRLTGTGNLNYLELPAPQVEGMTVLSRDDTGDFTATEAGYRGYREVTLTLVPEKPGQFRIDVPGLRTLDPAGGLVRFLPGKRFSVSVAAAEKEDGVDQEKGVLPFYPKEGERRRFFAGSVFYTHPWWYAALTPGPLVLLVVFLTRKKKKTLLVLLILLLSGCAREESAQSALDDAVEACIEGSHDKALALYENHIADHCDDAAAIFQYALCLYHHGQTLDALQAARNAVFTAPLYLRARSLVLWIEKEHAIPGGVMPYPLYHPDLFFLFLVAAVNAAALGALFRLIRGKGVYTILAILLFSLAFPATGFLLHSARERLNPPALVYEQEAYLTKIPSSVATPWFPLSAGTAVKVLQEASGYCLVRCGNGTEGWIPKTALLSDNDLVFLLDGENRIE